MAHISDIVPGIVRPMFRDVQENSRYPRMNPAASNQCHVLTQNLQTALDSRGIESRREFHQLSHERVWHFVVAHTAIDARPSDDDLITDLNPWQFMERAPAQFTFLHAPRGEVMERLQKKVPRIISSPCVVFQHWSRPTPTLRSLGFRIKIWDLKVEQIA